MTGRPKKPWTALEIELMTRMIDGGAKYPKVAPLVGHSIFSCRTKMWEIRHPEELAAKLRARPSQPRKPRDRRKQAASPGTPIAIRPLAPTLRKTVADAPYVRATSTAKFLMDAELRARIEHVGVTAGLFGDPLPGRSALDRQRAGIVEAPGDLRGRYNQFAAAITLANGVD